MMKKLGIYAASMWMVAGLALVSAVPGMAQNGDQYAAIAYSTSTHAVGYAYDAPTQEAAEAAALARCSEHADDCENRNWSLLGCSALAISVNGDGGWGSAWGTDHEEATLNAHGSCVDFNDSCQVYAWVCNSSSAPN